MVEWDDQGRPLRWVTDTESEWDDDQRDFVIALLDDEADTHPYCGHPLSESGHPDADPNNPDAKYYYQVSNPIVCHACEAERLAAEKLEQTQRRFKKVKYFLTSRKMPKVPSRRPTRPRKPVVVQPDQRG